MPSQPEAIRSKWNMGASLSHRWWQHIVLNCLHEHCTAPDVVALDKQYLFPAFSYVHQIIAIPFKLCRKQFLIQIAFSMTISKAQSQMLKLVAIYEIYSESKEHLGIQPAQLFHCTRSVIWCIQ